MPFIFRFGKYPILAKATPQEAVWHPNEEDKDLRTYWRRTLSAATASSMAMVPLLVGVSSAVAAAPPTIVINEIESNGGVPGDWVELFNSGATAVDISGFGLLDSDDTHTQSLIPTGTTVAPGGYYVVEEASLGFGLGGADSVRLFAADGTTLIDSYSWTAHASTTYGRCPNGTGNFAVTTAATKGAANDCSIPIKINEIESNGGVPGDWVELFNSGATAVDISGFGLLDSDDTHTQSLIPTGTTVAPGGYYVVEEASLGFGLGGADSVRLFAADGTTLIDSYSWTAHASTTYGRCPNGTGNFAVTTAATKGAANSCPGDVMTSVWPGGAAVSTADTKDTLGAT
ncbi:lamin tail domain-containing protein [Nakamurella antarctica]|uniref:lamin tail domain-containing protein n=1 Tax=Nakamurella antarctica TaxID=1902245 RepID=UPI0019D0CEBC|nr:lamin tail domain-containing protein [Nakamurella antarctica]